MKTAVRTTTTTTTTTTVAKAQRRVTANASEPAPPAQSIKEALARWLEEEL